jgi:hypothetical protein
MGMDDNSVTKNYCKSNQIPIFYIIDKYKNMYHYLQEFGIKEFKTNLIQKVNFK